MLLIHSGTSPYLVYYVVYLHVAWCIMLYKHVLCGLAYAASPKPALFLCDWAWPKRGVSFLSIQWGVIPFYKLTFMLVSLSA